MWNVDRHRRAKSFQSGEFTEDKLSTGAARVAHYKAVFNLRGDDGAATGGLAVELHLQVCKLAFACCPRPQQRSSPNRLPLLDQSPIYFVADLQ